MRLQSDIHLEHRLILVAIASGSLNLEIIDARRGCTTLRRYRLLLEGATASEHLEGGSSDDEYRQQLEERLPASQEANQPEDGNAE